MSEWVPIFSAVLKCATYLIIPTVLNTIMQLILMMILDEFTRTYYITKYLKWAI